MDTIRKIMYVQSAIFLFIFGYFVSPFVEEIKRQLFMVGAVLALVWLILGFVLIYKGFKVKRLKKKKLYVFLAGGGSAGFLIGAVLHNFLYALGVLTGWGVFEFLHAAAFLIALIGCPIVFLVGVIGYFRCSTQ